MEQCTIYARFSPRRAAEQSDSIEGQIDACREYAAQKGYHVRRQLIDRAMSGSDPDRPGLWDAIDGLLPGEILLCYRFDRLVRGIELGEVIFRQIKSRGAAFEVVNGPNHDDTPEGTLLRRMLAAVAEYERQIIGIRTRHAMRRAQANGMRMSARCPYGWKRDSDDDKRMVECPYEQEVLEVMRDQRRRGFGAAAIARQLTEAGYTNRQGEDFTRQQMANMLAKYGGAHGRERTEDGSPVSGNVDRRPGDHDLRDGKDFVRAPASQAPESP